MAVPVRTPARKAARAVAAAPAVGEARPEPGLVQGIAEQIKALIHRGEVAPGERLNEAALALRMGTSRGPIREAIRILGGIGLVTAVPNRGVFVRQISVREMLEIYELRALLFGHAAASAAAQADAAQHAALHALLDEMDAAIGAADPGCYYDANLRLHAAIMALGGNRRAHQAYDEHVEELHLFRRRHLDTVVNMRRSNAEHRQIVEAIAAGAAARARTLAQRHVLQGRQRLLAALDLPLAAGT